MSRLQNFLVISLTLFSIDSFSEIKTQDQADSTPIRNEFYVSSFNLNLKHCYTGHKKDICNQVQEGQLTQLNNYQNGDHDYFEVKSCTEKDNSFEVVTENFDDYSKVPVLLKSQIRPCLN